MKTVQSARQAVQPMNISHPIIVIAYSDTVRSALSGNLHGLGVGSKQCGSFCEAEDVALEGLYSGILVDLQSMVRAKAEEKIVACSLAGFYPTLRVRAVGSLVIPMAMPGDKRQDSTLSDFVFKTCAFFTARTLRRFKRRDVMLPLLIERSKPDSKAFTHNLSWGGAFIVDVHSARFAVENSLNLFLPEFDLEIPVTVRWTRPWGTRAVPGFGVRFESIDAGLSAILETLLNHDIHNARDRMVAR